MSIVDRILRIGEGRTLKKLDAIADQVEALADEYSELSDAELREMTDELKERYQDGETLDDLLPEAFATVVEAADRVLGMRPYHVQIMGGAALHRGNIAEMKTGEGKTLVATMPSYLRALTGKGVHVVTVNDYLAEYQSDLMGRVHRFLGLTTGCILVGQTPAERREQYACDITYGTNNEFGFDYLRDNMAQRPEDLVQRGHAFVIVDEVDSILIDEARTPLIISGPASGDVNKWYKEFATISERLRAGKDYEVDEKKRTVGVLAAGIERVEDYLGVDNLYESENTPLIGFLNNAIKAKELFHRDKDYIVRDGEVLIVDEHTGRVLPGRRYNEGMHQAIEAKERVEIKAENQTLATITLQNYFRLYPEGSRSGMTGTAETEAAEFAGTYKIGVVPIPTNKPMIRQDQPDLVYTTVEAKLDAVVDDIAERHELGQPVLVGTTSVEKSEILSERLREQGIPHEVLNAKQHAREAAVVAMAGRKGAVTVATNMAGRGTDIMLGGNAEHIAVSALKEAGLDPEENAEEYEKAWPQALAAAKEACRAEHDEVVELGGLYVLGTERHESRRIDNQLRGRSGRQGDPGESRFYLSMEDDLMRMFASGLAQRIMSSGAYPDDVPLESKMVTRGIAGAQRQVESRNYEIRKNVLKYDDVMTEQREKVYSERRQVLDGEDLEPQIEAFRAQAVTSIVEAGTAEGRPDEWDLDALWGELGRLYPVGLTQDEVVEALGGKNALTSERLIEELTEDVAVAYEDAEARIEANALAHVQLGEDPMRTLERRILLAVVDKRWREHLYEMDYLKEGIGLRAMAQRDPLVEYANEGARMFRAMMEGIREETVEQIFANVARFDAAAQRAAEDGTVEAAQAVAKANATAAAGIRVGQAGGQGRGTVLGDTGQASMEQRVTYSGPSESGEEETSGASSRRASRSGADSGGNRAERRRSRKKRRH
ncbi:preprotein translocase subunit SecA [Actinomyces sp. HMSC08A09]|uniref:Protein translocase subunit SecA n=3 Tax=Actinomyces TaxID=1654 RepID=A0A508BUU5_9ACTO|nr:MULTISPECIES: preprotein translocase subunit SecA [Actinomyces]PKY86184.1 preprotein translocase subunit SecA [Actinomyces naeslundii]EGE39082.1 preprotein translocase, SecA subunit [Actinomyces viscosus C505]OFT42361.1 preprotein translocase subunit SecA [Actinomyces sp. HMSC08A09]QQC40065.1 preprotein translocase subunit SecA [Actinomyces oris]TQD61982.1 preprotein translocase subunit SecA [Actinomyces oris]